MSIYMPRHFNKSTNFNIVNLSVNQSSVQISNFIWELNWRVGESFHKVKAFKFHYFCEFSLFHVSCFSLPLRYGAPCSSSSVITTASYLISFYFLKISQDNTLAFFSISFVPAHSAISLPLSSYEFWFLTLNVSHPGDKSFSYFT